MIKNITEIQKEFCANPKCPNHLLKMVDDRHYHASDKGVHTTGDIIYTLPYCIVNNIERKGFFRTSTEFKGSEEN